jgi:hypothetical protein
VDHPLALQFRRAVESLTAAQVHDSARQYRGPARDFLIYLGDQHPAVASLNQLRRDPHILGWFTHLRSLAPAVYISRLMRLRCILEELAWTEQLPELAHLIRREDSPRPPQRLPRALAAQQDQSIQQELLRRNDLAANIFSYSCATPVCASVNVSIFPGIAFATSLRIVGPFTCPSAS